MIVLYAWSTSLGVNIEDAPVYGHRVAHGSPSGFMSLRTGSSYDLNVSHTHDAGK